MKQAVRAIPAFARGGEAAPTTTTYLGRVQNSEGSIVYERELGKLERMEPNPIDDATAFMVHSMMCSGMERGSAAGLGEMLIEKPFTGAGKTGTTHDFSDNWFLGY